MMIILKQAFKFNKALSRLTVMLFMMVSAALVLGGLAFVMKNSKEMQPGDFLSFDRLKRFFIERKPLITKEEAAEIKSFVSGGGGGGLVLTPNSVNSPGADQKKSQYKGAFKNDEIIFRNNDVLTGVIISDKLSLKTEHGVVNFNFKDILAVYSVYETEKPYDKVITKNGDKIGGLIIDEFITLKTLSGDILKISTVKIKIINKNIESK